ncbi:MAG: glycosyltransferase family 4 protein [Acidimicrobiales bacterium]
MSATEATAPPRRRVLIVATRPPLPASGGFQLRLLQHLAVLRRIGWDAHLFVLDPASFRAGVGNEALAVCHVATDASISEVQGAGDVDRLRWIAEGTSPFAHVATALVRADLQRALEAARPDLVIVSGQEGAPLIDDLRPMAPVVLDLHNVLPDVIEATTVALAPSRPLQLLTRAAAAAAAEIEAQLVGEVDQVWTCSDVDGERIAQHGQPTPVVTVPNTVDVTAYGPPAPSATPTIVLTASFSYAPNLVAATTLLDLLPSLPGVALDLVGASTAELLDRAAPHPAATVSAHVDDVRPHLAAAWLTAMPIPSGSGTRLKVAEAGAAGVPIVASAKAVEGLPVVDGEHYLQAESPSATLSAIRRLLGDADLRAALAHRMHCLTVEALSWEVAERACRRALAALPPTAGAATS